MNTIICEKPFEFSYTQTAIPVRQAGEALIRVCNIGICGTDLHAFQGNQPFFSYPRILGHELSGVVEEIEENNTVGLSRGDEVALIPYLECGSCIACRKGKTNCCTQMKVIGVHADGGMREKIAVPVSHLIKTNGIHLEHAALLEPLSIGAHAVRRANLQQGETILVIGAGPIGLGVMAIAGQQGAHVIAMDINDERLAFCKSWAGVKETVNALHDPLESLSALTDGELSTAVFDATGSQRSMMNALNYTAHGGRLIYVGLFKGNITFSDPEFHKKEMTLMGSRNATKEDFDTVIEMVKSEKVDMNSFITHRASFDEMINKFDGWLKPESKVIKAVVTI